MNTELRHSAPTPEIQAELQRLEKTLRLLQDANAALVNKLEPVVAGSYLIDEKLISEQEPMTALGRYVRALDDTARLEVARIVALTADIAF